MDINKYHNSKIYQITDIGYSKCYIGSTTEELSMRMVRHRSGYKSFLRDGKGLVRSFEIFSEYGVENCKIELIEYFKCDTLQELRKREGEVIKKTECVNKCVAGRTEKEYDREYRDKHKEQLKERRSAKCLCECGKEYALWNKSSHQKTIFHQNWFKENS